MKPDSRLTWWQHLLFTWRYGLRLVELWEVPTRLPYDQIKRHSLELIKEIKYPDGSPAFRIVKTNP